MRRASFTFLRVRGLGPVLVALLIPVSLPASAEAQWYRSPERTVSAEARLVGGNMLLGGAGAALVAGFSGEPLGRAFLQGAAGGALVYGGKNLAAARWFGAGAVGRQVGLAGGVMTRNAGLGRGPLAEVALGVGPVRWYRDLEAETSRWGVDVPAAGLLAWGILDSRLQLDMTESLSAGAAVFVSRSPGAYGGDHALPGTILRSGWGSEERVAYILAHERVHLLQFDQFHFLLGDPTERWVGSRLPASPLPFTLELNAASLFTAAALGLALWPDHDDQPWEWEAMYLARGR